MSILIMNFVPHDRSPYEQFLKDLGEDLILLTSDECAKGFKKDDYVYMEIFENYRYNQLVEYRALELYQKYQYHTIIANAEADIIRAAKLREHLNLKGQRLQSAIQYRDKVVMKQIAKKNGLPTPPFAAIDDSFDLFHFIEQYQLPIVLKPRSGVGSRDTYVISNKQELEELLRKGIPPYYMAEKFIPGEVYHVDGIIHNGELVFICASKYLNEPIQYHNKGYLGSYVLDPQNPLAGRLCKMTEQLISVLDTPAHTTIHAEWFHTVHNEIILCEIASRTGGGKIVDNLYTAYNIHLDQAFVRSQCGLPLSLPGKKDEIKPQKLSGWVKIPPKQGIFVSAPIAQLPEWVKDYQLLAQPGQSFNTPNGIREYIASFIVEGDSELEVYEKLIQIADWFHQTSSWQDSDLIAT